MAFDNLLISSRFLVGRILCAGPSKEGGAWDGVGGLREEERFQSSATSPAFRPISLGFDPHVHPVEWSGVSCRIGVGPRGMGGIGVVEDNTTTSPRFRIHRGGREGVSRLSLPAWIQKLLMVWERGTGGVVRCGISIETSSHL